MLLGMGFFGSCWGSPITQPVQNLGSNQLIADDNDMSYRNIATYYAGSMTSHWDSTADVPYYNSATAGTYLSLVDIFIINFGIIQLDPRAALTFPTITTNPSSSKRVRTSKSIYLNYLIVNLIRLREYQ